MAQLRDKVTSQIIFEGTPEQVARMAADIGQDEVIFDDVGAAFDPQAVIVASNTNLAGLEQAATEAPEEDRSSIEDALAVAQEQANSYKAEQANAEHALEEARARVER